MVARGVMPLRAAGVSSPQAGSRPPHRLKPTPTAKPKGKPKPHTRPHAPRAHAPVQWHADTGNVSIPFWCPLLYNALAVGELTGTLTFAWATATASHRYRARKGSSMCKINDRPLPRPETGNGNGNENGNENGDGAGPPAPCPACQSGLSLKGPRAPLCAVCAKARVPPPPLDPPTRQPLRRRHATEAPGAPKVTVDGPPRPAAAATGNGGSGYTLESKHALTVPAADDNPPRTSKTGRILGIDSKSRAHMATLGGTSGKFSPIRRKVKKK